MKKGAEDDPFGYRFFNAMYKLIPQDRFIAAWLCVLRRAVSKHFIATLWCGEELMKVEKSRPNRLHINLSQMSFLVIYAQVCSLIMKCTRVALKQNL